MPKVKPLHDRIVVKKVNIEMKSAGGLFLGEIESERDMCFGKVISVGSGKQIDSAGVIPMTVKEGDVIAFNDAIAKRLNYTGEAVHIIRESDVYGILEDEGLVLTDYVSEKQEEKRPMMLK